VYETILGTYTDISTAEEKARLVSTTEAVIRPWAEEFLEFFGNQQWKISVTTNLTMGRPNLTYSDREYSADRKLYQRTGAWPIGDWSLISNKEVDRDWYVMARVTFSKVAIQPLSALTNLTLHIPRSKLVINSGVELDPSIKPSSSQFQIGSTTFRGQLDVNNRYPGSIPAPSYDTPLKCSGLTYQWNGDTFKVSAIVFDSSGSGYTLTADEVTGAFSPGTGPSTEEAGN
jgi:hypothetical protein